MIFQLEIENFYSIREKQVIDLRVAANVLAEDAHFAPIYPGSVERAPKIISIFGPNASGKSTVLRTLAFLAWFVQDSFKLPVALPAVAGNLASGWQPCSSFFSEEANQVPTRLCVYFSGPVDFQKPREEWTVFCQYAYEVVFKNFFGSPRDVAFESLRYWPNGKPARIFERDKNGHVKTNKIFDVSEFPNVDKLIRNNVSVISTLVQFGHLPSIMFRDVARTVFSNIFIETFSNTEQEVLNHFYTKNSQLLADLNRDLEKLDLGLRSMEIIQGRDGPVAQFHHVGLDRPLPVQAESLGTRRFIEIFPLIAYALYSGGIAVIDELDNKIHPLIIPEIIGWFLDSKRNQLGAQLWMTCHSATVLEYLEKEEIFFCEKDQVGCTTLYGLKDIQAVRRADNYYKKYLGGEYGAVPHIG